MANKNKGQKNQLKQPQGGKKDKIPGYMKHGNPLARDASHGQSAGK